MEKQTADMLPKTEPGTPNRKRENPFSSSAYINESSTTGDAVTLANSLQLPGEGDITSCLPEPKSGDGRATGGEGGSSDGEGTGGGSPAQLPLIDVDLFVSRATELSEKHIAQIAESNKIKLEELINHQRVLLESLEHENEKFTSSDCFSQMQNMISKCRDYNGKLLRIRKSMGSISQRTVRMKKQCAKLHEAKAKTLVEQEETRRKEIEREKLLVAQPIASGAATSNIADRPDNSLV